MRVLGSNKKVVDYLKSGQKVLIKFDWHGMGDCVMFLPLYNRLKELYPDVSFNLVCNYGQEYFEDKNDDKYDIDFDIVFPEFNNKYFGYNFHGKSKPEICCEYELGIPFTEDIEFTWEPNKVEDSGIIIPKNAIGVAFQVTSNPNKSIEESVAFYIWDAIKQLGFTPVEIHFSHKLQNERNSMYGFIDRTCRTEKASVNNCIDVINKCKGFIGVNTGTFCMATAMKNGNVLHMYKMHHFSPNYKRFNPVPEIDCREKFYINMNILENYLRGLK